MKFELGYLETLIHEKENIKNDASLSAKLEKEKTRITTAWQQVVMQEPIPIARKYFQQHQLALVRIANEVIDASYTHALQAQATAAALQTLLEFQYQDFLQLDYVIPQQACAHFVNTFSEKRRRIVAALEALHIDSDFEQALTSAFAETITVAELGRLTYRRKLQMEELLAGIKIVMSKAQAYPDRLSKLLIAEFARVNLNTMESYLACRNYLESVVEALPNLSDQIQQLKKQQAFLRHCKSIKQYYFTYNSRTLSRGLLDWATNQIHQLENKSHAVNIDGENSEDIIKDSEKVMTSLSRPELALMVLLFFKAGVFINRYKAAVARFMALFVRTRKKSKDDHQSPGKLYSDMKHIKISTVDTVDAILDRMKRENQKLRKEILSKGKKTIK